MPYLKVIRSCTRYLYCLWCWFCLDKQTKRLYTALGLAPHQLHEKGEFA